MWLYVFPASQTVTPLTGHHTSLYNNVGPRLGWGVCRGPHCLILGNHPRCTHPGSRSAPEAGRRIRFVELQIHSCPLRRYPEFTHEHLPIFPRGLPTVSIDNFLESTVLILRINSVAFIRNQPPPPGRFNGPIESQGHNLETKWFKCGNYSTPFFFFRAAHAGRLVIAMCLRMPDAVCRKEGALNTEGAA